MYYLLDFTKHQFVSCENASMAEAKIRSLLDSGCSQDFIEVINGYGDGTRMDVSEFRAECKELGLLDSSIVDFLVEREKHSNFAAPKEQDPAPMISLWCRLGVSLNVTPEELAVLKNGDRTVAEELFIDLVRSERCAMSGDTYFPVDCNEKFIGGMEEDLAFDLDCALHDNEKHQVVIASTKLEAAKQCLVDNGIERDEAEIVLQALGYILMDKELIPSARDAEDLPALDDTISAAEKISGTKLSAHDRGIIER